MTGGLLGEGQESGPHPLSLGSTVNKSSQIHRDLKAMLMENGSERGPTSQSLKQGALVSGPASPARAGEHTHMNTRTHTYVYRSDCGVS